MLMDSANRSTAAADGLPRPLNTIHQELSAVSPYISVLLSQLDDILKESEAGVLTAISKANALDASYRQAGRLDQPNPQSVEILTDLLGGLQFQDVVRQRLEQVCKALSQLDAHFTQLAATITDPAWQGECAPGLRDKMARFSEDYVMHSQVEAHLRVQDFSPKSHTHQAIELF